MRVPHIPVWIRDAWRDVPATWWGLVTPMGPGPTHKVDTKPKGPHPVALLKDTLHLSTLRLLHALHAFRSPLLVTEQPRATSIITAAPAATPLAITFRSADSLLTLQVSPATSFLEVMAELKARARLTAAENARLHLAGLWYRHEGQDLGPIQTQADWLEALRITGDDGLLLTVPGQAIDFDAVSYRVARGAGHSGGFGTVFRCMHLASGYLFAAKVVKVKDPGHLEDLYNEVRVMAELDHPHIVGYLGAQRVEEAGQLRILMEYCPGGTLKQALSDFERFPESLVQHFTHQLLQALAYLNHKRCVHRDIKPENIMLDLNTHGLKLCDFGLSIWVRDEQQMQPRSDLDLCGTPAFLPPEMITESRYGHKGDVWSLGCSLLCMLTGSTDLYEVSSPQALLYHIGRGKLQPRIPEWLSAPTAHFLSCCIAPWTERPDAAALLAHPFVCSPLPSAPIPVGPPLVLYPFAPPIGGPRAPPSECSSTQSSSWQGTLRTLSQALRPDPTVRQGLCRPKGPAVAFRRAPVPRLPLLRVDWRRPMLMGRTPLLKGL